MLNVYPFWNINILGSPFFVSLPVVENGGGAIAVTVAVLDGWLLLPAVSLVMMDQTPNHT